MTDRQTEIILDPTDPFERIVYDMIQMNRKKRHDYASDGDIIQNFRRNADMVALLEPKYDIFVDCFSMVTRKISRLQNLLGSGKTPNNESIEDTLTDLAVYCVLLILCYQDLKDQQRQLPASESAMDFDPELDT
jgi:hypothetical protein